MRQLIYDLKDWVMTDDRRQEMLQHVVDDFKRPFLCVEDSRLMTAIKIQWFMHCCHCSLRCIWPEQPCGYPHGLSTFPHTQVRLRWFRWEILIKCSVFDISHFVGLNDPNCLLREYMCDLVLQHIRATAGRITNRAGIEGGWPKKNQRKHCFISEICQVMSSQMW